MSEQSGSQSERSTQVETQTADTSNKILKYEVGNIVKIGEIEYKVIGTDNSKQHPSGAHRKWDYWLRAEKDARDEFRISEDKLAKLMAGNTEDEKG